MEISLIRLKKSLVITPISNILFQTKEIIDQGLIEEISHYNSDQIQVFNLHTQSVENIKSKDIKDNHWYYNSGTLCKILHIIEE